MNVYYNNWIAALEGPDVKQGSLVSYILDPMLELTAEFKDRKISLTGKLDCVSTVDSFCIANTNALDYRLEIKGEVFEKDIENYITILNFDKSIITGSFTLELAGIEPVYLGHLFLGQKTVLPRFGVEPETGMAIRGESSRSFGGQAFGIKRKTLSNFSVNYPRLTNEERQTILEYIEAVQNIEPHVIDPYPDAKDEFSPMYATLNVSDVQMTKRNESGFYFNGSLAWQEAR
ncbi:MAG: hypothetical protein FWG89_04295 [Treponema sp.]|nr:hypothetical protein [Treponema sp.]